MANWRWIVLSILLFGLVGFTSDVRLWIVYGEDGRRDLYEINDNGLLDLAAATVGLVENKNLSKNEDGLITIHTRSYSGVLNLCPEEKFREQPIGVFCSGFLIAPDLIATAGHCIKSTTCGDTSFVFGFDMQDAHTAITTVPIDNVYSCKEVIGWNFSPSIDFAVVRLDRPVVDRTPLKLRLNGSIDKQDEVFVIGHPSGLPTKIANGAKVRSLNDGFFVTNLDTYGGNSGSAVFNTRTYEVEGILVRGGTDYIWDYANQCRSTMYCHEDSCRGEDVTFINSVHRFLPQ